MCISSAASGSAIGRDGTATTCSLDVAGSVGVLCKMLIGFSSIAGEGSCGMMVIGGSAWMVDIDSEIVVEEGASSIVLAPVPVLVAMSVVVVEATVVVA